MAVGLGGICTCLDPTFDLNSSWQLVALRNRLVVIFPDNDLWKPQIARAVTRLCRGVRKKPGAPVLIPHALPASDEKVRPDDFVAKNNPNGNQGGHRQRSVG